MVVNPALVIVTSPFIVTSAARFEALPIKTLPLVSAVPTGDAFIVAVPPKSTVFPLIVIELFCSLALVTFASAIFAEVTALGTIVVAPVLEMVTSPFIVTSAARFEALPTKTLPLVSAVPIGEAFIVAVPPKATVFPLIVIELFCSFALVTFESAILVVVTALLAIEVATVPVPVPLTSPVKVVVDEPPPEPEFKAYKANGTLVNG